MKKKAPAQMSREDEHRLAVLSKKSKRTGDLSREELIWCDRLYKKYPAHYREVNRRASEEVINEFRFAPGKGIGGIRLIERKTK